MTRALRALIVERDGPRCRWCGRMTFEPFEVGETAASAATVDHLVAKVDGGSKRELGNLVLACRRCNDERGRLPVADWRAMLRRRRIARWFLWAYAAWWIVRCLAAIVWWVPAIGGVLIAWSLHRARSWVTDLRVDVLIAFGRRDAAARVLEAALRRCERRKRALARRRAW